ncbi:copper resistance protein CopC [Micromonospora sp. NBC_01699]|uniref:copper resistance CopC/CopD family protein n=1 Tax=Micromonospora sp. NBC_01699 TaxID=2975984 RepID=UPI002E357AEB|nr:copper resistance protein CopC [Micromonospora sp. NBC_01699]
MSRMTAAQRSWVSRAGAMLGLLLATFALLLGPASPASAHAVLVSSSPATDAVLPSAPAEVVLTFSEGVRNVPDKIRILGPDGARVDRGDPVFDGAVVTIPVDPGGPQGTYLVSYRVISADSHPVAGAYTYSVGAPSTPPTDTENDSVDPAITAAVAVGKYLGYAGLVLLVGPVLVLSLLWPQRLDRRGPARLVWTGFGLVTAATLIGIWLQVPYTTGGALFSISGSALSDVLASTFGAVLLVRLGILVAAAILLRPLLRGSAGRADHLLLGVLGVAGLFTWPLAGHGAASPVPAVSVLVDAVHVGSMAVWLGGLLMLVVFLLRRADERELGAILPIWSRWAAVAVSALLLAGIVQALIEVATPSALIDTTYGRLIIAKVVLFGLVIGVAAYSRRLVQRRIATERPGRMRRAVWTELGVTALILAISAVLVQTPPGRTAEANDGAAGAGFFSTRLTSDLLSVEVEVDPAGTGSNTIHLYAYTPDNKPQPVVEWTGTAALPAKGVEAIEIPLLPLTDNHATGEISLPTPGDWQLRFTVRISDIDQATVTATVPIN